MPIKAKRGLDQTVTWIVAVFITGLLSTAIYLYTKSKAKNMDIRDNSDPYVERQLSVEQYTEREDHEELENEPAKEEQLSAAQLFKENLGETGKSLKSIHQSEWSYNGESGPERWADLDKANVACGVGKYQSPIDIQNSEKTRDIASLKFFYKNADLDLRHENAVFRAGVAAGSHILLDDEKFDLVEIHFHAPSEHKIDGIPYDMEIQFVHQDEAGHLAIVSVMGAESREVHPELAKIIKEIPAKNDFPNRVSNINLQKLLPGSRVYLHYLGSLTIPPCSEKVAWYVMADSIKIADRQIEQLSTKIKYNARPIQPLYSRKVKRSWN